MWINLSKEDVDVIERDLDLGDPLSLALVERLHADMRDRMDPAHHQLLEAAKDKHQDEGSVEVDEQSDNSVLVSIGDEGAYVMAWVFVPFADEDDDAEGAE